MITDKFIKKITGSKIFGMKYVRADGTIGSLTGRFKVTKTFKNKPEGSFTPSSEASGPKDYVNVFDVKKDRFNRRPIKSIISITMNGVTLTLADLILAERLGLFEARFFTEMVKKSGPKKNNITEYVVKSGYRVPKFSEINLVTDFSKSEQVEMAA